MPISGRRKREFDKPVDKRRESVVYGYRRRILIPPILREHERMATGKLIQVYRNLCLKANLCAEGVGCVEINFTFISYQSTVPLFDGGNKLR